MKLATFHDRTFLVCIVDSSLGNTVDRRILRTSLELRGRTLYLSISAVYLMDPFSRTICTSRLSRTHTCELASCNKFRNSIYFLQRMDAILELDKLWIMPHLLSYALSICTCRLLQTHTSDLPIAF